jgi:hypothetical protein
MERKERSDEQASPQRSGHSLENKKQERRASDVE